MVREKFEGPSSHGEVQRESPRTLSDAVQTLASRPENAGLLAQIESFDTNHAAAQELVRRDPLHATFLLLQGSADVRRVLSTPQKFLGIFSRNASLQEHHLHLVRGLIVLRDALHKSRRIERTGGQTDDEAQRANRALTQAILNGTVPRVSDDALAELKILALTFTDEQEIHMIPVITDTLIATPEMSGRKLNKHSKDSPVTARANDTIRILQDQQKLWSTDLRADPLFQRITKGKTVTTPQKVSTIAAKIEDRVRGLTES